MISKSSHRNIGIAAIAFAAFLFLVGIPFFVTSPSNVRSIFLSPLFWPEILAGLLALGGLALILASRKLDDASHEPFLAGVDGGFKRLSFTGLLMLGYVLVAPTLGLVWTSMIAFILVALIVKTRHPIQALIAAVLVPLVLYAFFAHVAGIAVPQGEFIRLP